MTRSSARSLPLRLLLGALLATGATVWSVSVRLERTSDDAPRLPSEVVAAAAQGAEVDLLLDLDDDLDGEARARVAQQLDDAIAPFPWQDGSLGVELSHEAALFRVHVPRGELRDVVSALRHSEALEGLELEHTLRLPEDGDFVDVTPADDEQGPAEPSVLAPAEDEALRGGFRPNDPYYKHQWHLDQIQMPAAWLRTRGRGSVVAVIDTGVLYRDHERGRRAPDLAGTRFVPGWDFVDGDDTPDDEHGHGTHVAGTVAQSTHNAIGVAGVAPEASIMPLRVLDARGAGRSGNIAAAIRWAADHGAHIINMSLGGGLPSRATESAIRYAHGKGVLVVAAAGNTGRGRVEYPAAHDHVVAVGAVRADGARAFYSSFGAALDLMAPGGDLRVDQNGDGMPDGVVQNTMLRGDPMRHDYLGFQGTSMAAPHVAGVAALLRAQGLRDPDALERVLRESAREAGPANDFGAGILQADDALRAQASERSWGGAAAAGLALFALFGGGGRRRRLRVAPSAAAFGAFVVGGGLSALLAWSPATAVLGTWCGPHALLQLGGVSALLAYTAGLPVLAYGLAGSVGRLGPALSVLSFAVAGQLVWEAVSPSVLFMVIPSLLVGPWLLANALCCVWVGWAAARPS
ncbi:MAG: peptidase S8 [Sandaracinaceae bacterium]|nr:peptidase S8 [Sandaracinaceae bacterium]